MMLHCDNSGIPRAAAYIGADRVRCFYLYMDMMQYGAEAADMDLWLCEDGGAVRGVFYRYFDTIHMFSRGDCPHDETAAFFCRQNPPIATMPQADARALADVFDDGYECELSNIITAPCYMEGESAIPVTQAGEADVDDIVAMMMKEHIYSSVYTPEKLRGQLLERLHSGFGRLFVMRENGRVLATNCTSAETEDMAVISGLVTDPAERGRGLGRAITASTWNRVKREGKQGLAHIAQDNLGSVRLHQLMGYDIIDVSARFVRK